MGVGWISGGELSVDACVSLAYVRCDSRECCEEISILLLLDSEIFHV